jgi:hypothetical protein
VDLLKKIIAPLIVPFALSLMLHGILIAGLYGLEVFDFIRDLRDTPITAFLLTENTSRPVIARPLKVQKNISAHGKLSAESGSSGHQQKEPAELKSQEPVKTSIPADDASLQPKVPDLPGPAVSVSPDSHAAENAAVENKSESSPTPAMPAPATVPAAVRPESKTAILKTTREKLFYRLYWLNIYVGRAELEAVSKRGKVTIISRVHSAPFISTFYKVDDYARSTIIDGAPVNFRIKQHEGKYRSDKETVFDAGGKLVTFFDYLKGTRDDHPVTSAELWDLISGFYYLRSQIFEVGKTVYIDVFDSNKFFRAEISIIGKERLKVSENEEMDTLKVKPVIKSEGLFQSQGEILIWLTDDDNKTPVRIETKVPIGKVVAVLKSLETER